MEVLIKPDSLSFHSRHYSLLNLATFLRRCVKNTYVLSKIHIIIDTTATCSDMAYLAIADTHMALTTNASTALLAFSITAFGRAQTTLMIIFWVALAYTLTYIIIAILKNVFLVVDPEYTPEKFRADRQASLRQAVYVLLVAMMGSGVAALSLWMQGYDASLVQTFQDVLAALSMVSKYTFAWIALSYIVDVLINCFFAVVLGVVLSEIGLAPWVVYTMCMAVVPVFLGWCWPHVHIV